MQFALLAAPALHIAAIMQAGSKWSKKKKKNQRDLNDRELGASKSSRMTWRENETCFLLSSIFLISVLRIWSLPKALTLWCKLFQCNAIFDWVVCVQPNASCYGTAPAESNGLFSKLCLQWWGGNRPHHRPGQRLSVPPFLRCSVEGAAVEWECTE